MSPIYRPAPEHERISQLEQANADLTAIVREQEATIMRLRSQHNRSESDLIIARRRLRTERMRSSDGDDD